MSRIAYVDGRYVPLDRATTHVEDRGYQFADGVYEVVAVLDGKPADEAGHLDRLDRSLKELRIAPPVSRRVLQQLIRRMIRLNRIRDGLVYMQITRGRARRDFPFPKDSDPILTIIARPRNLSHTAQLEHGISVITVPDIRWLRRDIKSVSLLPDVLAKQAAVEAGAGEAWMVDEKGFVTEGSSSNAWIVTPEGKLVTRQADNLILRGVTRTALVKICAEEGVEIEERPFTVAEAHTAREAFLTSATTFVFPIVRIDDHVVGNGAPGLLSLKLREAYVQAARAGAGAPL